MEYTGLVFKYKINRPLTDDERARQLNQKARIDVNPVHQLTLLRVNSTYLETVDKFYVWRGYLVVGMGAIAIAMLYFLVQWVMMAIDPEGLGVDLAASNEAAMMWLDGFLCSIFTVFLVVGIWGFIKDACGYRYYPLRFNRKTRMVHVFRLNGTVLSVPWDEVFFTRSIGVSSFDKKWNVRGHVLDKDGVTVKETFALGFWDEREEAMNHYWEYIRRYMEGEPMESFISTLDANDSKLADYCSPILFRRETWYYGFRRNLFSFQVQTGINFDPGYLVGAPISFVVSIGRYIAMRLSKQPHWPAEIEAQCVIEPNDPYERDARHNQRPLWGMKVEKTARPA